MIAELHGVVSKIRCAAKCTENPDCWSFSYQPLTEECVHSKALLASGRDYVAVQDVGAILYSGKMSTYMTT